MSTEADKEFLTVTVGKQSFGIPVLQVRDVLEERKLTRIPLARREISGSMNLRGRIVTAVDIRRSLQMPDRETGTPCMYVVIEHDNEPYSLVVDSVGEVLTLSEEVYEKTPATLDTSWSALTLGVYRLKENLLMVLDVPRMLEGIAT